MLILAGRHCKSQLQISILAGNWSTSFADPSGTSHRPVQIWNWYWLVFVFRFSFIAIVLQPLGCRRINFFIRSCSSTAWVAGQIEEREGQKGRLKEREGQKGRLEERECLKGRLEKREGQKGRLEEREGQKGRLKKREGQKGRLEESRWERPARA